MLAPTLTGFACTQARLLWPSDWPLVSLLPDLDNWFAILVDQFLGGIQSLAYLHRSARPRLPALAKLRYVSESLIMIPSFWLVPDAIVVTARVRPAALGAFRAMAGSAILRG